MDFFYQTEHILRIVSVKASSDGPIYRDLLVFSNLWFRGTITKGAHVRVARPNVLKCVDRDLQSLHSLLPFIGFPLQ